MTEKEFDGYIRELETFYKYEMNEIEYKIWYDNLKFMSLERFNYIIAQIYKKNTFFPRLAEMLEIHKNTPYEEKEQVIDDSKHCKKCGNSGYIRYWKEIDGNKYEYMAVCNCGRKQKYDDTKIENAKYKLGYVTQTVDELGITDATNIPSLQQIVASMNKAKQGGLISENLLGIIRKKVLQKER